MLKLLIFIDFNKGGDIESGDPKEWCWHCSGLMFADAAGMVISEGALSSA